MWARRFLYLAVLLICLVFYGFYREWFSWFLLVTVALLPWFSLLLSLPAMLTAKAEVRCPRTVRLHVPARSSLQLSCRFPLPKVVCRIRLHNNLTGGRFVGTPGELIPSQHCGCMHIEVDKLYICDYLGLFQKKLKKQPPLSVFIWPKPIACPLPNRQTTQAVRAWKPKPGGGFAENHDLRPDRPGDELRGIHWKMSAKTGRFIYREPIEPAQKGGLLQLTLWGDGEMLDKKLGQLLYLSRKLLAEACPHEVRCRTGQGLLQAHIETPDQLEAMLERLLAASCATGESAEYSQDVLWQHRIGGDDHEA